MKAEVGISARHCHITKETFTKLFGEEKELTKKSDLKQPGQFASNETIGVVGKKGSFDKVRILGPYRSADQVELAMSDCFKIGVKSTLKHSGDIEGSSGCTLVGPMGEVVIDKGVIVALRHVHLSSETAIRENIKDHDILKANVLGERAIVFENVLARVSVDFVDEIHFDTDEANAAALQNNLLLEIIK